MQMDLVPLMYNVLACDRHVCARAGCGRQNGTAPWHTPVRASVCPAKVWTLQRPAYDLWESAFLLRIERRKRRTRHPCRMAGSIPQRRWGLGVWCSTLRPKAQAPGSRPGGPSAKPVGWRWDATSGSLACRRVPPESPGGSPGPGGRAARRPWAAPSRRPGAQLASLPHWQPGPGPVSA